MLPLRVNPALLFTTYDSVKGGSFSQDPSYYFVLRYQVLSYSLSSLNGVHTNYVIPTTKFHWAPVLAVLSSVHVLPKRLLVVTGKHPSIGRKHLYLHSLGNTPFCGGHFWIRACPETKPQIQLPSKPLCTGICHLTSRGSKVCVCLSQVLSAGWQNEKLTTRGEKLQAVKRIVQCGSPPAHPPLPKFSSHGFV